MKLVIFGPTGGTGQQLVQQALEMGHWVTAVARRPEVITQQHERLNVVRGDVLDAGSIAQAVCDQDAVISSIGVQDNIPTMLYSEGTASIIAAMQNAGVRRLTCLSAAPLGMGHGTPWWQKIVIPLVLYRIFGHAYEDMVRMEALVERSALDWTLIRAPRLTNKPKSGKYRVALDGHLTQIGISRADVADYILRHIEDAASFHKRVELAY